MLLRVIIAVIAAALLAAAPAGAQGTSPVVPDEAPVCTGVGETVTSCSSGGDVADDPASVGPGEVITDPEDEIEGPKVEDDSGAKPQERGELHVLPAATQSSPATQAAPRPAKAAPQRVASAPASPAAGSAKTLPFTGVDAGPLALIGALLVAAGLGLRRTLGASA